MDEMNKYFESKGFEVRRQYHSVDTDCNAGWYEFIITKNNNHRRGKYMWPADQQEFMDRMIRDFERTFCEGVRIERRNGTSFYADDDKIVFNEGAIVINKHTPYSTMYQKQFAEYCENDVKVTEEVYRMWSKMNPFINTNIKIKNVIFNPPATIVFWTDGTKTVVKCQEGDMYDPEKGLAMAISKKALGNKGNYCNELKKWLPKEESAVDRYLPMAELRYPITVSSSDLIGLAKIDESED
jgi:hypothetical protein